MKTQKHYQVRNTFFKSLLGLFTLMLFVNCSTNPISCLNGSWAEDVATDLEAWSTALSTYSEDPTVENCNSYKGALNGYINALNGVKDCYGGVAGFNGDLDEAKQELSEIDCTEN